MTAEPNGNVGDDITVIPPLLLHLSKMIIIISNEFDPHADSVIHAFKELGYSGYIRIDLETAFENFHFVIESVKTKKIAWSICSKFNSELHVDSNTLQAIWWRRSTAFYKSDHLDLPTVHTVDNIESYWMLRNLFESLDYSYYPLGHPLQMRSAENKIKQIQNARDCEFLVPETILTNIKKEYQEFLATKDKIVIKPLRTNIVKDEAQTCEISLKSSVNGTIDILSYIDSENAFSIFSQSKIEKIADIRVTVLNSKIIACNIDTSKLPGDEVDWRPNTWDFEHSIIQLPGEIECKIFKFMNLMNIRSGYFDFGLDSEGNYWFIECNPNAQWLWIQLKTGYSISFEIANQLINLGK